MGTGKRRAHRFLLTVKGRAANAIKLSRSLSGVEAILPASASLSQRFILPKGT